jgi:hypothetical protein
MTDAAPQPPAPWTLRGEGWVLPFRLPTSVAREVTHLPDHRASELRGGIAVLMLVDYASSPVGPYRELLTFPGMLPFADGRSHPTIDRIVVDSHRSVLGGRANWGIPKELGSFSWNRHGAGRGTDQIEVAIDDVTVARFTVRSVGPHAPALLSSLPGFARTVAQERDGTTFVTKLSGHGRVAAAIARDVWIDQDAFPDLTRGTALPGFHAKRFTLTFGAPQRLPQTRSVQP